MDMTFEARSNAFVADVETFADFGRPAARMAALPAHDAVADPEAGWAARNPERALAFLFVSPRDCAALDELMAA
jgi:hypothetical protein